VQADPGLASTLSVEYPVAVKDLAKVALKCVQHSLEIVDVLCSQSSSADSQLSFTVPAAKNVEHVARHGL
jgi:hypothetical protein